MLKCAISKQEPEVSILGNMSSKEWQGVMDMAVRQGVLAVCFESIEKTPQILRTEMDILMDWLGQTSYIESQYEHHLELAKELTEK